MSTELAMNAYVLLGNALHLFVNGMGMPPEAGVSPDAVRSLYTRIQPMIPAQIESGIAALAPDEKATLGAICRYVILQTAPGEASATLGLPPEVIDQTLSQLGLK